MVEIERVAAGDRALRGGRGWSSGRGRPGVPRAGCAGERGGGAGGTLGPRPSLPRSLSMSRSGAVSRQERDLFIAIRRRSRATSSASISAIRAASFACSADAASRFLRASFSISLMRASRFCMCLSASFFRTLISRSWASIRTSRFRACCAVVSLWSSTCLIISSRFERIRSLRTIEPVSRSSSTRTMSAKSAARAARFSMGWPVRSPRGLRASARSCAAAIRSDPAASRMRAQHSLSGLARTSS